jgi:hypothetical protein
MDASVSSVSRASLSGYSDPSRSFPRIAGDAIVGKKVALKAGALGRLFEPLVAYQLKRISPRTLAAFKYLVENGEPPTVKHTNLPRVATAC